MTGLCCDVTIGAVNSPLDEMEPWLELQTTVWVTFPEPLTTAEHWLVAPELMMYGVQVTDTAVTVGAELPQAVSSTNAPNTTTSKRDLPRSTLFIGSRSTAHRSAALLEGRPVREMRGDDRFAEPPG